MLDRDCRRRRRRQTDPGVFKLHPRVLNAERGEGWGYVTGPFVRCLNANQPAFKQANGFSELISHFLGKFLPGLPLSFFLRSAVASTPFTHQTFISNKATYKEVRRRPSVVRPSLPLPESVRGQRQRGKKCQARNQTRFCPRCLFSSLHRRGTIHLNMHAGY